MSSSVQLDSGKTRIDSPLRDAGVVDLPHLRAAGSWGPSHGWNCGTRRCAPWRGSSPRRAARRRRPRRSRGGPAPGARPPSSSRGVHVGAVAEGADPLAHASSLMWTIRSSPSLRAISSRKAIISRNFQVVSTCRKGKGGLAGIEGLHRQMQHDRRILADRIEHHRLAEGRRDLAEDMDRFGFLSMASAFYG
jgi:hypothetical protein